ncbi:MAG TPA: hypothetical protein VI298_02115, partial [Geobacteraceae bacterium]
MSLFSINGEKCKRDGICAAECPRKLTLRAKMSPEARANIGSAKPLFGGSNPLAASTKTKGV